jgi:transposase InsO family protein
MFNDKRHNIIFQALFKHDDTPYGATPEYLIHDNDAIFTSAYFQQFLKNANIKRKKTGYHCPWQNGICERVVGILRRELLDYVIPFNKICLVNM